MVAETTTIQVDVHHIIRRMDRVREEPGLVSITVDQRCGIVLHRIWARAVVPEGTAGLVTYRHTRTCFSMGTIGVIIRPYSRWINIINRPSVIRCSAKGSITPHRCREIRWRNITIRRTTVSSSYVGKVEASDGITSPVP